jgi:hypothetical protein
VLQAKLTASDLDVLHTHGALAGCPHVGDLFHTHGALAGCPHVGGAESPFFQAIHTLLP